MGTEPTVGSPRRERAPGRHADGTVPLRAHHARRVRVLGIPRRRRRRGMDARPRRTGAGSRRVGRLRGAESQVAGLDPNPVGNGTAPVREPPQERSPPPAGRCSPSSWRSRRSRPCCSMPHRSAEEGPSGSRDQRFPQVSTVASRTRLRNGYESLVESVEDPNQANDYLDSPGRAAVVPRSCPQDEAVQCRCRPARYPRPNTKNDPTPRINQSQELQCVVATGEGTPVV